MQPLGINLIYSSNDDDLQKDKSHAKSAYSWESDKGCTYPIELVFAIYDVLVVKQIRIVSHEYKIPYKIDVLVNEEDYDINSFHFRRLGHITFSRNSKSNYKSRELKVIDFQLRLKMIKLVIHDCRKNSFNSHNQVSLVDFVVLGEKGVVAPNLIGSRSNLKEDKIIKHGVEMSEVDLALLDLGLPLELVQTSKLEKKIDEDTQKIIEILATKKMEAILAEDYPFAKEIKSTVDSISKIGEQIFNLREKQQYAINFENFDDADSINKEIEKLKNAKAQYLAVPSISKLFMKNIKKDEIGDMIAQLYKDENGRKSKSPTELRSKSASPEMKNLELKSTEEEDEVAYRNFDLRGGEDYASGSKNAQKIEMETQTTFRGSGSDDPVVVNPPKVASEEKKEEKKEEKEEEKRREEVVITKKDDVAEHTNNNNNNELEKLKEISPKAVIDERPIKPLKDYDKIVPGVSFKGDFEEKDPAYKVNIKEDMMKWLSSNNIDEQPQELTNHMKLEYDLYIVNFGEYATKCLVSKNWKFREQIIKIIETRLLETLIFTDILQLFKVCCALSVQLLSDNIPGVYLAAIHFAKSIFDAGDDRRMNNIPEFVPTFGTSSKIDSEHVNRGIFSLLPLILQRAADDNRRVKQASEVTILFLAAQPHINPSLILDLIILNPGGVKNSHFTSEYSLSDHIVLNIKLARAQIKIVRDLVAEFGFNEKASSYLNLETVVKFGCLMLGQANADLRSDTINLLVTIYQLVGKQIEPHFEGVRPQVLQILHQGFEKVDSLAASSSGLEGHAWGVKPLERDKHIPLFIKNVPAGHTEEKPRKFTSRLRVPSSKTNNHQRSSSNRSISPTPSVIKTVYKESSPAKETHDPPKKIISKPKKDIVNDPIPRKPVKAVVRKPSTVNTKHENSGVNVEENKKLVSKDNQIKSTPSSPTKIKSNQSPREKKKKKDLNTNEAATKVQALARGKADRRKVSKLKEEKKLEGKITKNENKIPVSPRGKDSNVPALSNFSNATVGAKEDFPLKIEKEESIKKKEESPRKKEVSPRKREDPIKKKESPGKQDSSEQKQILSKKLFAFYSEYNPDKANSSQCDRAAAKFVGDEESLKKGLLEKYSVEAVGKYFPVHIISEKNVVPPTSAKVDENIGNTESKSPRKEQNITIVEKKPLSVRDKAENVNNDNIIQTIDVGKDKEVANDKILTPRNEDHKTSLAFSARMAAELLKHPDLDGESKIGETKAPLVTAEKPLVVEVKTDDTKDNKTPAPTEQKSTNLASNSPTNHANAFEAQSVAKKLLKNKKSPNKFEEQLLSKRLLAFYTEFNPEKAVSEQCDKAAAKFASDEESLINGLLQKYKAESVYKHFPPSKNKNISPPASPTSDNKTPVVVETKTDVKTPVPSIATGENTPVNKKEEAPKKKGCILQ